MSRAVESNHALQKFGIASLRTNDVNLILLFTSAHNLVTLDLIHYDMTLAEYFSLFRFLEKNEHLIDVGIHPYLKVGVAYKYVEKYMQWACSAIERRGVSLQYTLDVFDDHSASLTYFQHGAKVALKETWKFAA